MPGHESLPHRATYSRSGPRLPGSAVTAPAEPPRPRPTPRSAPSPPTRRGFLLLPALPVNKIVIPSGSPHRPRPSSVEGLRRPNHGRDRGNRTSARRSTWRASRPDTSHRRRRARVCHRFESGGRALRRARVAARAQRQPPCQSRRPTTRARQIEEGRSDQVSRPDCPRVRQPPRPRRAALSSQPRGTYPLTSTPPTTSPMKSPASRRTVRCRTRRGARRGRRAVGSGCPSCCRSSSPSRCPARRGR